MSDSDETSEPNIPTPEQLERHHETMAQVLERIFAEQRARLPPRDDPINPSMENILFRMSRSSGLNPPDTKRFFINNNGRFAKCDSDGEPVEDQKDDPRSMFWQNYPYKEPSNKCTDLESIPEDSRWIYEYFIEYMGYIPNDEWFQLNRAEIEKQVDLMQEQYSDEVKEKFVRDREHYLRNWYNQTLGDFRAIVLNP